MGAGHDTSPVGSPDAGRDPVSLRFRVRDFDPLGGEEAGDVLRVRLPVEVVLRAEEVGELGEAQDIAGKNVGPQCGEWAMVGALECGEHSGGSVPIRWRANEVGDDTDHVPELAAAHTNGGLSVNRSQGASWPAVA